MRDEYDFSKGQKNPYTNGPKQQITININASTAAYFKNMTESSGIPYRTLISLYLSDCAENE